MFRIKEMIWEKEPRRGDIIITPGETGGYKEVLELRAPKAAIQIFLSTKKRNADVKPLICGIFCENPWERNLLSAFTTL